MGMQCSDSEENIMDEGRMACGGTLPDTTGYPSAIYRGEQIYFCTESCLRLFELQPDAFMAGKIEHPFA